MFIDCNKHIFHLESFLKSDSSFPVKNKEEIEWIIIDRVLKKAINFILDMLEDINAMVENKIHDMKEVDKKTCKKSPKIKDIWWRE